MGLKKCKTLVIVVEACFWVVVLARIYSDTSPPKEASFFTPLSVQFSKSVGDEIAPI